MRLLPIVIAFLLSVSQVFAQTPPKGWRFPYKSEVTGDWKISVKENYVPYFVKADFNNDRVIDRAWILMSLDKKRWGLFVYMGGVDHSGKWIRLDETKIKDRMPQTMGIGLVKPGKYKTAEGKGYGKGGPREPSEVVLKCPGIDYFMFESANSFFYWEDNIFKRVWISD